jgi:predicted PurR-regulated permease PerM
VQATASGSEAATDDGDTDRSTITVGRDQATLLAGGAINSLRAVGGVVAALLISSLVTLLIAVYVNADSHKFSESLMRYVPAAYQGDASRMAQRVTRIWKGYLYGQLVNSLATGLLVWLVLWAVGLPGAFVLGVIMALLNMIPTFGPILAAIPGVLSAIALGSTRFELSNITFALIIIGIYVLVVQVQANLMAPFITGRAVRMSPASILIGLLVGVQVAGLVGALLVVPVMATGKELFKYASAKLVGLDPFDLPDEPDDPDDPDDSDDSGDPGDRASSEAPGGHAQPPDPPGTATETGAGGASELPGSHRN